jgi:Purple acid Phosphatase, N-terminal domain
VTTATPDSTAPTLSAIGVSASTSTATVSWFSSEAATSKVYLSTTTPLSSATAQVLTNATLVTNHSVAVSGLIPNTTYYFRVESADAVGNTATSSETSFVTSAVPVADTTAPVISGIGASGIASTSATIGWNTNELATSKAYYGLTTPLATSSALSTTLAGTRTAHTLGLLGLTASSTYYVIVESIDASNNVATGAQFRFITL